jgi:hypothetical protein
MEGVGSVRRGSRGINISPVLYASHDAAPPLQRELPDAGQPDSKGCSSLLK